MGSLVWVWLGSDNNKGQPTKWTQGIRALARCDHKENLGGQRYLVVLQDVFLLPRAIEKAELLQSSPETYAQALSNAAIVGLNNYSSQVVQLLDPAEFATITALIARLLPEARGALFSRVPEAENVNLIARQPLTDGKQTTLTTNGETAPPFVSDLPDGDPIFEAVVRLVIDDGLGGALLQGPPGTGKSWYARQIALRLVGGDPHRVREVQFHPSYQYEDFVEGYVPDPKDGFRLADKHLLEMAEVARKTDGPVVLIIDELSRTDPSRVFGEAMTYMEGSLRGVDFYLPSGRKASIPKNLVFLATMNPEDRSVDEIDAAMDRRWGKVELEPDVRKVRDFLTANKASGQVINATINLFTGLQNHIAVGHAFFRTVKDSKSLSRLWETQLRHVAQKRFRFDAATRAEVEALWTVCLEAITPASEPAAGQAAGVAPNAPPTQQ